MVPVKSKNRDWNFRLNNDIIMDVTKPITRTKISSQHNHKSINIVGRPVYQTKPPTIITIIFIHDVI